MAKNNSVVVVAPVSARAVARAFSGPVKAGTFGLGRSVTDKMVRSMARDKIERFDKDTHPAYQGHAYSPDEVETLFALFGQRAAGRGNAVEVLPTPKAKVTPKGATRAPAAKRQTSVATPQAPVTPTAADA